LIGHLTINGSNLRRDVQRGSDIEITVDMSESRDLTVTVYLAMIDQEFKEVFAPKSRATSVTLVQRESGDLTQQINQEIQAAEDREDYEAAATLKKLRREASELSEEANDLTRDDVTDKKYQLEDRKRKLAQQLHDTTRDKILSEIRVAYQEEKETCHELVDEHGNDQERKYLRDVEALEAGALSSGQVQRVQELIDQLSNIRYSILWRVPAFLSGVFNNMERHSHRMNNPEQAERLIQDGRRATQSKDWPGLRSINHQLIGLLPREAQQAAQTGKIGF
jgi:molecular chaperone DnaK